MKSKNIGVVFRNREYSPNHIGTDAAILNQVCDLLRKRGCSVFTYSEDALVSANGDIHSDISLWLSMARSPRCLDTLSAMEARGARVVNSVQGVVNSRRGNMCRILAGNNIPLVDFYNAPTNELIVEELNKRGFEKCWVKQADAHSKHKEDVTFVRHAAEAQEISHEFFMRGIEEAVVCRHVEGEPIRFYGVRNTPFFLWFFTMRNNENGQKPEDMQQHELELSARLQSLCDRAAEVLELDIYGGDCTLLPSGDPILTSVNDFPSFAPCRVVAAKAIVKHLLNLLKEMD